MGVEIVYSPKYPKHGFTNNGQIYSKTAKRFLKTCLDKDGYVICGVIQLDGRRITKRIHRIVAELFIPNPEQKPIVNHKDGNKANNDITNLEWVTAKENRSHAVATGLFLDKAQDNSNSKLRNEEVLRIRCLYETGLIKQEELARIFKVSQVEIGNIVRRDNWRTI